MFVKFYLGPTCAALTRPHGVAHCSQHVWPAVPFQNVIYLKIQFSLHKVYEFYTENPKWIIWLIWAIVCHYTDKKTHFSHIFESFCPCTDPLWLKWVKWFTWVFLCIILFFHSEKPLLHVWCTTMIFLGIQFLLQASKIVPWPLVSASRELGVIPRGPSSRTGHPPVWRANSRSRTTRVACAIKCHFFRFSFSSSHIS